MPDGGGVQRLRCAIHESENLRYHPPTRSLVTGTDGLSLVTGNDGLPVEANNVECKTAYGD